MKDFDSWTNFKKRLNAEDTTPLFKEREIWWASIGVNIGHEQDGKNAQFNRPVLIVRKFNRRIFWGVPLTTQIKQTPHYHAFTLRGRKQCAMLTQMRLWDANRLTGRIGRLPGHDFQAIREKLIAYLT